MKNSKKNIIITLVFIGIIVLSFSSYSIYKNFAAGNANVAVAKFQILLNNSSDVTQSINLEDTITANNYSNDIVVPGTNGTFDLELNFTDVEVSTNYIINFDTTNIPNNLKLYSDSNYTNQITSINSSYTIGSSKVKTHTIYWKWAYLTDDNSNTNDNLFMNQNISIPITITLSQIVGDGN